uniref:Uncharacterized protein n=1 Tax=Glossina palpalis gambiensis TaxID=67801 RepID=A0A1B0BIT7_9MUSC
MRVKKKILSHSSFVYTYALFLMVYDLQNLSMLPTTSSKVKLPSDSNKPSLHCLLNGPLNSLHFSVIDQRLGPIHDSVFLDHINSTVTALNYRQNDLTGTVDTKRINSANSQPIHKER